MRVLSQRKACRRSCLKNKVRLGSIGSGGHARRIAPGILHALEVREMDELLGRMRGRMTSEALPIQMKSRHTFGYGERNENNI